MVRNESGGKHQSVKVERNLWRSANGEEGREGGREGQQNKLHTYVGVQYRCMSECEQVSTGWLGARNTHLSDMPSV